MQKSFIIGTNLPRLTIRGTREEKLRYVRSLRYPEEYIGGRCSSGPRVIITRAHCHGLFGHLNRTAPPLKLGSTTALPNLKRAKPRSHNQPHHPVCIIADSKNWGRRKFTYPSDYVFSADSKNLNFMSITLIFMEILGNFDRSSLFRTQRLM